MIRKSIPFRIIASLLFLIYLFFSSTFLLFTVLEFVPSLISPKAFKHVRYYAQRRHYQPDSVLVFVPSQVGRASKWDTELLGDQYSSDYGISPTPIPYHATYTTDAFRANTSTPPFEIMVVGDSYVEFGETDELTFPEQLKRESGRSTFNLGRGWYGPFQYLELFKRYAPRLKPRYAVLCYFDGNDADDTKEYLRWQSGESYYNFALNDGYMDRYFMALRDTYQFVFSATERPIYRSAITGPAVVGKAQVPKSGEPTSSAVHPDLGIIALGDRLLPMRFTYWNPSLTAQQLLRSEEWQAIGQLLQEFRRLAVEQGTIPILVFIPKKIEVYGAHHSPSSGHNFLQRFSQYRQFEKNSHGAFLALAERVGVRAIDLLPAFRSLAEDGKVLYYPFDTHWNQLGRQTAAEILASYLRERSN